MTEKQSQKIIQSNNFGGNLVNKSCSLVVPGLLDIARIQNNLELIDLSRSSLSRLKNLELFFARSKHSQFGHAGLESVLFELFDVSIVGDRDLPVAPISYLVDAGRQAEAWGNVTDLTCRFR